MHCYEARIAVIIKELDPYSPGDRFEKAGREAEEQMAYYLRRAFKDDAKVRVLNGIRLIRDGEVVQMDHLILHKYGFVIIESKSVTTEVRVDQHGAWTRAYKGTVHGMKSPVIQARMQADLLFKILDDHSGALLGKLLGLQKRFGCMPIDVLVAISDGGVLKREAGVATEVCKADQVPNRVVELIAHYRKLASPFTPTLKVANSFGDSDAERIASFLLAHHTPCQRGRVSQGNGDASTGVISGSESPANAMNSDQSFTPALPTPEDQEIAPPASTQDSSSPSRDEREAIGASCAKCNGTNLKLEYRYNFFLRCADCKGATPLILRCADCRTDHKDIKKPDTFKDKGVWSIKCSHCGLPVPVEVPHGASAGTQSLAGGGG